MKKIKNRAYCAIILAILVVIGLGVYITSFMDKGGSWATFSANQTVYVEGELTAGSVYDRNGVMLVSTDDSGRIYADDALTRTACLHTVGDFAGNIGTGIVTAFADNLIGYSPITGLTGSDNEIYATIDSSVSNAAYSAMDGRSGAVFVYNYETGDIICMVSTPSYDPLNVPDLSTEYYEGVYLNRCISSTYTPGSVFKIITLAAAVENISDLYTRSFYCSGSVDVAGVTINCSGTHGSQTIEQAFANSCNCAFAEITLEIGADTLEEYVEDFGILDVLEFDGIGTAAGLFDKDVDGSAGLAWAGIGQYNDLISPFAMARVSGAVAGGGTTAEPHILLDSDTTDTKLMSADTAESVRDIMSYTVTNSYGTWNFPNLTLCAKSGTAEVGDGTSHAWFTGFLEDPDHPYAFAVIVENSGGGLSVAGSIANTVLQEAVKIND